MEAKEEQTRIAPSATPQDKDSLFADLVAANRILADQGVVDGYGHVMCGIPPTRITFTSRAGWRPTW